MDSLAGAPIAQLEESALNVYTDGSCYPSPRLGGVGGGKAYSHRLYFDQADFMTQLGLMPAPTCRGHLCESRHRADMCRDIVPNSLSAAPDSTAGVTRQRWRIAAPAATVVERADAEEANESPTEDATEAGVDAEAFDAEAPAEPYAANRTASSDDGHEPGV